MTWTVSYAYGTIADCAVFDDFEQAEMFHDMIAERIQARAEEFGDEEDDGEYEPFVEIS